MLIELRIANFAVIERLSVRLERGLNVLSGETGAGKSIIVDALSLLLGERASAESVRPGADKAVVEGVFDLADRPELVDLLHGQGLDTEDGLLILRREVAVEGRNRAWVNGAATTAGFVGELGRRLVDLHGQHEHQALLRPDEQRRVLDAYAGATDTAEALASAHRELRTVRDELESFDRRRAEIEQRADFLRFQLDEIEKAGLQEGEEARLEEESRRLAHAEDLASHAQALHQGLYAGEGAVTEVLGTLKRELEKLVRIDPSQRDAVERLESAYFELEELGRRMGEYAAGVEHDPGRLDRIQRRQDLLFRLKSKYGGSLEEVIETGRRARRELDSLDAASFERRELEKREAAARERVAALAAELSAARREAADRLAGAVLDVLPALGLPGSRFQVALEPLEEPTAQGAERVELRVSVNPGFEPRPLAHVASGGELSRVMLALKTILARLDRVPTLVFDEIDAGIGGRIAVQVGAKLRDVAGSHQVFAITHLPQIASRAHHHLLVEKVERDGTTLTRLSELEEDDRVRELARMLGGDPESETSLEHARELLEAR